MRLFPFLRGKAATVTPPEPAAADSTTVALEKAAKTFTLNDLFYGGWNMPWSPGAIGDPYSENVIAYACIRRQALDVSGAPLLFLRDPEDAESEVEPSDPVRMLFKRPAGNLTTSQLIQFIVTWTLFRGEAFCFFDDPLRPRLMYAHFDPANVRADVAPDGTLIRWHLQRAGSTQPYFPSDVIHHKLVNPADPVRGLSPLKPVLSPEKILRLGDALVASMVERGGPPNVYETEKEMLPKQQEELLAYLLGRRAGIGIADQGLFAVTRHNHPVKINGLLRYLWGTAFALFGDGFRPAR